jgi:hypothetical protein
LVGPPRPSLRYSEAFGRGSEMMVGYSETPDRGSEAIGRGCETFGRELAAIGHDRDVITPVLRGVWSGP